MKFDYIGLDGNKKTTDELIKQPERLKKIGKVFFETKQEAPKKEKKAEKPVSTVAEWDVNNEELLKQYEAKFGKKPIARRAKDTEWLKKKISE